MQVFVGNIPLDLSRYRVKIEQRGYPLKELYEKDEWNNAYYIILKDYSPDKDLDLKVDAPFYSEGFHHLHCPTYVQKSFGFENVELLTADILVDSNNDGILDGDDNTSETTLPGHVFWVNNDDDYDESTVHPDDKDAKNSSGNDSSDSFINGIRDLEDFTPINIKIPYIKQILQSKEENLKNITFYLKAKGSGRINVYKKE